MSGFDMNTLWSAGKKIHGYTMLEDAHEGSNSVWGKAKSPTGQTVFFKKYNSPSSRFNDWYRGYVDYQKEIKKRIDAVSATDSSGRNTGPTYRFIEFFELRGPDGIPEELKNQFYYQVLEYIDGAKDLETYLASPDTTWNDRKTFASVFMFAMKTLHTQCKIIHTDLKPKNLLLIPVRRSDGSATYQIKVIDLDMSILKDKQAPWHNSGEGYTGSPGYYSPEHLRGQVPTEKSDIFTCGLILYEILTQEGHPYQMVSELEKYEQYGAPVPHLLGTYGSAEKDAQIVQMLHRMLDPNPENRPNALEVQRLLISSIIHRPQPSRPEPQPTETRRDPQPPPPPRPEPQPTETRRDTPPPQPPRPEPQTTETPPPTFAYCKLKTERNPGGMRVLPDTTIGGRFLESLEPEAKKYYSREHFKILFRDGKWFIRHCAPAGENRTALNKTLVTGEVELHDGDVIEAASQNGSKTVMPLVVEIGG